MIASIYFTIRNNMQGHRSKGAGERARDTGPLFWIRMQRDLFYFSQTFKSKTTKIEVLELNAKCSLPSAKKVPRSRINVYIIPLYNENDL